MWRWFIKGGSGVSPGDNVKQIYELPSGVSIEFQYEPGWEKFGIAWQSEEWGQRKPAFGLHRLYQRALFMDALSNAHSDFIGLVRLEYANARASTG